MNAIIISVGNELTLGQTVDTNTAWLSQQLAAIGIPVTAHITVADEMDILSQEIRRSCELADVVLISGGLGPTEDDLTRQALAAAMGVELELNEVFVEQIKGFFAKRGRTMPDANVIQAHFPNGSQPIENTCGTAPGIRAEVCDSVVFVMPGVPREMKVMYERNILPELARQAGGGILLARNLWCYGAGESDIGEKIRDLMLRGKNPTVGTTAQQTVIGIRICAGGRSRPEAEALLQRTVEDVKQRLGILIFGADDDTLWSAVARLLVDQRKTIATAESCTGGLIAKSLTDIAGSSAYFLDGVVTYSNAAKTRLLDVPQDMIAAHGAVSPEVAEAMAVNCRIKSGSDYAISVTGIAGPTGGTTEKPVGLVYIALADAAGCEVYKHQLGDFLTREEIRDRARKMGLNHLRLRLIADA